MFGCKPVSVNVPLLVCAKFDTNKDPKNVEIDFIESKVSDHSGIEAISNIAKKYKDLGISVRLIHLSQECQVLLLKAEPSLSDIIETSVDDPRYYVMSDLLEEN